jgi:hypothetical protein
VKDDRRGLLPVSPASLSSNASSNAASLMPCPTESSVPSSGPPTAANITALSPPDRHPHLHLTTIFFVRLDSLYRRVFNILK